MEITKVQNKIDQLRLKSENALSRKNLNDYMSIFHNSLEYKQLNGKIINKTRLRNDQKHDWNRIISISYNTERIESSIDECFFNEIVNQDLTIGLRVFLFFKIFWNYKRKSKFKWVDESGNWTIIKVEVLEEKITKTNTI